MSPKPRVSPVATLISSALKVPWARAWAIAQLRERYAQTGTQTGLANELGVVPSTVVLWLQDPEVRAGVCGK